MSLLFIYGTIYPNIKNKRFYFCPKSVYLHRIYENFDQNTYHQEPQKVGKLNHGNIDKGKYSTAKNFCREWLFTAENMKLRGKLTFTIQKQKL